MFGENIVPVDRPSRSRGPAQLNPDRSNGIGLDQRIIIAVSAAIALGIGFVTHRAQLSHVVALEELGKDSYLFEIEYYERLDIYRRIRLVHGLLSTWIPGVLSGFVLIGIRHVLERRQILNLARSADDRCTLLLRPFAVDGVDIPDFPVQRQVMFEKLLRFWFAVFVLNLIAGLIGLLSEGLGSLLISFVLGFPVSMMFMVLMARYLSQWILSRRKITVPERLGLPVRKELGTFVAFGGPQYQSSRLGPRLLICPEATWQATLRRTLERSKCVLIMLADTPSVLWEFEQLLSEADLRRVFILIDPTAEDNRSAQANVRLLRRFGLRPPKIHRRLPGGVMIIGENRDLEILVVADLGFDNLAVRLREAVDKADAEGGPKTVFTTRERKVRGRGVETGPSSAFSGGGDRQSDAREQQRRHDGVADASLIPDHQEHTEGGG